VTRQRIGPDLVIGWARGTAPAACCSGHNALMVQDNMPPRWSSKRPINQPIGKT
jgi:hypothetical protein